MLLMMLSWRRLLRWLPLSLAAMILFHAAASLPTPPMITTPLRRHVFFDELRVSFADIFAIDIFIFSLSIAADFAAAEPFRLAAIQLG